MRYGEAKRLLGYMKSQGWERNRYRKLFEKRWIRYHNGERFGHQRSMMYYEVIELKKTGMLYTAIARQDEWANLELKRYMRDRTGGL